jgi:hypothetical protein
MAKVLTGKEAEEYVKKNPNASFKAYDAAGNVLSSKEEDKGFLGGIVSAFTKPLANFGNTVGAAYEDQSQPSKFITSEQKKKLIENPAAIIGQKGLGAATTVLPFGSGLKTAALAGGLSGLSEADLSNPSDVLSKTALGAGGSAAMSKILPFVGKGFGKVGQAFAPKAEGALENAAQPSRVNQFFKNLEASDVGVPKSNKIMNKQAAKNDVVDVLNQRNVGKGAAGFGSRTDQIERGLGDIGQEMESVIDNVVKKNPNQLFARGALTGDVNAMANELAVNNPGIQRGQVSQVLDNFFNQGQYGEAGKVVAPGMASRVTQYNTGDVAQMLRDVRLKLRDKQVKGNVKDIYSSLEKQLEKQLLGSVPEYGNLQKQYAILKQAQPSTSDLEVFGEPSASQNIIQSVLPVNQLKNKAVSTIGSIGSKITSGKGISLPKSQKVSDNLDKFSTFLQGKGVPQSKIAQLAGSQIALEMFDEDGDGQLNEQEQANADNAQAMESDVPTVGGDPELESARSQSIAQLMNETDKNGKRIYSKKEAEEYVDSQLEAMGYDVSGFQEASEKNKALTTKQKEQLSTINSTESRIQALLGDVDKFGTPVPGLGSVLAANPFDADRKGFDTRLQALNKELATAMEGKSPTDADMRYYSKFLPNQGDTADTIRARLNAINEMLGLKKSELEAV